MLQVYKRGANIKLTKNFSTSEFDCNCRFDDCTYTLIEDLLVNKLQGLRDDLKQPLHITSGFRCQKHNSSIIDSSKRSQHLVGRAVDVKFPVFLERQKFIDLCNKHFGFVLVYKKFVHLDIRRKKYFIS